jgi:GNAT superfamily N-acetyltransferase
VEDLTPPRLLQGEDDRSGFDCGVTVLDDWFRRRALTNHLSGASKCYVASAGQRIAGFYCLSAGSVQHEAVPGNIRRNMPEPIPIVVMGRLAVDLAFRGKGLGAGLLAHAIERTQAAAEIAGIRALLVHAKDETSAGFYRRSGFMVSPLDPMMLLVRV